MVRVVSAVVDRTVCRNIGNNDKLLQIRQSHLGHGVDRIHGRDGEHLTSLECRRGGPVHMVDSAIVPVSLLSAQVVDRAPVPAALVTPSVIAPVPRRESRDVLRLKHLNATDPA